MTFRTLHHTPRIRRKELREEIGQGVDASTASEGTDKGREGQNDNIVRGKDRKDRNGEIEDQEERGLRAPCAAKRERSEKAEKTELIEEDGEGRHRQEENEDLYGIDLGVGEDSTERLPEGNTSEH